MSTIKSDNYEATTAGGNLIFKTNSIEKMRIVPDGTLTGVGVNLGGNALSLNTNGTTVHIHEPTAGRASMLHCTSAAQGIGAAKGFICGMWSNNDAYCYTYDPVSLQLGTNSTIRMTITSAGDVGIGNQAPPCKLYVQGEARSSTSTTSASDANTLTTKDYVDSIFRVGAVVNIGTNMTAVTTPQGVPSGWTVTIPASGNATIRIPSGGGTWFCTWIHRGSTGTIGLGYLTIVGGTDGTFPVSNGGVYMVLRRIS